MGDPSDLRLVPSSCATTPIDWTKVPEASKKFLLYGWGEYWEPDAESDDSDSEGDSGGTLKTRPLPATIDDLAKMFDGSKFFGYMTSELCTLLLDISEFGLAKPRFTATIGLPVGPRFYMKYVHEVWFVLFVPGSRDAITGYSPKIPHAEDSYEDTGIARDKALAEDYDVKLCEEASRIGTLGAVASNEVAGWESSTLKRNLELAQMMKAFMGLSHPARVGMMQGFESMWSNP